MAHETTIALRLLTALLRDDEGDESTGPPVLPLGEFVKGVYRGVTPQKSPLPYVLLILQGVVDTNTAGARVVSDVTYLVKIVSVDGTQDAMAQSAADRIDVLLTNFRVIQDGHQIRIERGGIMPEFPETVDGKAIYRHMGAYWRIYLSSLSVE